MKKYIFGTLAAVAMIFSGCNNGEEFNDAVFMTGTLTSSNVRFLVDGQSEMALTVSSSAKASSDVTIEVKATPEMLEAYNKKTGRNYQLPPEDAYSIEGGKVVIKSGTAQSTQVKLSADGDKLQEGVGYCLPVSIASVEGADLQPIESARTAYILFTKVINIKAANLGGNGGFDIKGFWISQNENSPVQDLKAMTLEMKVLPVSFPRTTSGDAGIASLCGCEENFLFRFGDGAGFATNKLQLAKGSIGNPTHPDQKEHFDTKIDKEFPTGHWLHFAAVYDGHFLRIYLDGELIHSVESQGGSINLSMAYDGHSWDDGFSIGRSTGYKRYFNGYVSECRVWNVARTLDEIENGICYIDPTSEGLVAYWRFNGEVQDDGTVRDETGHGYDATPFGNVQYVDNQKCPF